jgi:SAM-dependent methyltransferase
MNFEEIKKYWNSRAASDSTAQATTQDVYLRQIEATTLVRHISGLNGIHIGDFGCGDGRTTIQVAAQCPGRTFVGLDYSDAMIANARSITLEQGNPAAAFEVHDVLQPTKEKFDIIYTTRCLINLPSFELQSQALQNIHDALNSGGHYLMIENFIDGQNNFNQLRKQFGLSEIPVRPHNLFFDKTELLKSIRRMFSVVAEENISSLYYIVSRIVYAKICHEQKLPVSYFDDHHRFASGLPFLGDYGPVKLVVLQKLL